MADEKEGAMEAAVEASPAGQPKDKTKSLVIILIILAILVMVLTPVITIFAVGTFKQKEAAAAAAATTPEKKEAVEIPIPRLEVNVGGTQGTRIIQVDVIAVVSDAQKMKTLFEDQKEGNSSGKLRKIKDILITIFSSKNLDGLLSLEAKDKLRKEIKDSLNDFLRQEVRCEGMVTDIYFNRFIVQ